MRIGMLVANENEEPLLQEACAYVASNLHIEFYRFFPDGMDRQRLCIHGDAMVQGKWEAQLFRYPDAFIDRLKKRGTSAYDSVYRALKSIPSTDERNGGSFSKLKLYQLAAEDPELAEYLLPYIPLEDSLAALRFIEAYGIAMIKPSSGSYGQRMLIVELLPDGYLVKDHRFFHRLNPNELNQLLNGLTAKKGYFIQQFVDSSTKEGYPYHLRVHLVRNANSEWVQLSITPYISLQPESKIVNHASVFRAYSRWKWFVEHQFSGQSEQVSEQIAQFSRALAARIERAMNGRVCELGIDLGIDKSGKVWLYEVNMNRIGAVHHEFELAKIIVPVAAALGLRQEHIH